MPRATVRQHVDRIIAMTGGLLVPVAFPHDGGQHDKGSGIALKKQYADYGLNMLSSHAVNFGTDGNQVAPAISEINGALRDGKVSIDPCNRELIAELMNYHYDEKLRLVKVRDDLVSAMRYAFMDRRRGKHLDALRGCGFGSLQYSRWAPRQEQQQGGVAKGTHFDLFNPSNDFPLF
jgi:hypothetical protein